MKKLILGLFVVFVLLFGCTSQTTTKNTAVSPSINAGVNTTVKTNVSNTSGDKELDDLLKSDLDKAISDLEEIENLSE
ncbi:MAG: hypothetical protein AABX38_02985 [Candidatus Micrarchaeota archaeon]